MKKLLMGSLILTCFAFSIIAIQISCQKAVVAQSNVTNSSQIGKILFVKNVGNVAGTAYTIEIWTANYDGSNATKVNIVLPNGIAFDDNETLSMSPNGQKIFFTAGIRDPRSSLANTITITDLYSCNVDGSSVTKIIDKGGAYNRIQIGNAY
jgi:Tol biopolymer transport system component